MQLHEIALRIPVESALADLVGLNLDEGVVAALFLHREMKSAEYPGVSARSGCMRGSVERQSWKKFISDIEYL